MTNHYDIERRTKMKTIMYRQGRGWIVSRWDKSVQCYRLSSELSYQQARASVGTDNCRHPETCDKVTHDHEISRIGGDMQ